MALFHISGILYQRGQIASGESRNTGNAWKRCPFVLEAGKMLRVAFTARDEMVDELQNYRLGQRIEVDFTVHAHEYQGKWYNDVEAVGITPAEAEPAETAQPAPAPAEQTTPEGDDLPF